MASWGKCRAFNASVKSIPFNNRNIIILFIDYELDAWSRDLNANFTLGDCLFAVFKLNKNADPDKFGYNGYVIGLDARLQFSLSNGE